MCVGHSIMGVEILIHGVHALLRRRWDSGRPEKDNKEYAWRGKMSVKEWC